MGDFHDKIDALQTEYRAEGRRPLAMLEYILEGELADAERFARRSVTLPPLMTTEASELLRLIRKSAALTDQLCAICHMEREAHTPNAWDRQGGWHAFTSARHEQP